jgi:uncharacterized membrane protein YphA (DoxX/SURF4 family)
VSATLEVYVPLAIPQLPARRAPLVIALWVLTVLLALFFTMMGVPKVLGQGGWGTRFAAWGYPSWFVVVVGVAELGGAIMLLVPQLATLGGFLLALVMLGAVATHLVHGETARVLVPLVVFAVLTAIAWARRNVDRTRPNLV